MMCDVPVSYLPNSLPAQKCCLPNSLSTAATQTNAPVKTQRYVNSKLTPTIDGSKASQNAIATAVSQQLVTDGLRVPHHPKLG